MQPTEEHQHPVTHRGAAGPPALVVGFPRPAALPLPASGSEVGRAWFEIAGLDDSKVSRAHVRFSQAGPVLQVEDVGSRNGTWLNGHRLPPNERVRLTDGGVLRVGRTLLVYRERLRGSFAPSAPLGELVGPYGLRELEQRVEQFVARPPPNVLLHGETGAGKELLARAIAQRLRPGRAYVALNAAGVPAGVFEGQLFGYVAGAYSGAGRGADGLILSHAGGTVFLDELGELPIELQPKLLRLLDNREVFQVGAVKPRQVDVLIVAATNRDLGEAIEQGAFRRDLRARFAGAELDLPPLRARPEDVFAIAQALAARRGQQYDPGQVDVEAVELLMFHAWPSNVRELHGALERAAAETPPPALRLDDLQLALGAPVSSASAPLTREVVQRALAECGGNQSEAARRLGVSRGQLLRFLRRG